MKRHRNEPIKDQYRLFFNHLIGVGKALVKRKEILHENNLIGREIHRRHHVRHDVTDFQNFKEQLHSAGIEKSTDEYD